jgi:hypothetical protein
VKTPLAPGSQNQAVSILPRHRDIRQENLKGSSVGVERLSLPQTLEWWSARESLGGNRISAGAIDRGQDFRAKMPLPTDELTGIQW